MNKAEFATLAATMKAAYPHRNFLDSSLAMDAWYDALSDLPCEVANAAVKTMVLTEEFPSIAIIRRIAVDVQGTADYDWSDGWKQVKKAISAYGMYDESGALESMDEATREAVKKLGWQSICQSPADSEETLRAQFRQVYELTTSKKKEAAYLPENLRNQIAGLKMIGGQNDINRANSEPLRIERPM